MPIIHTWDDLALRIHFRSNQQVRRAGVRIELRTADGAAVCQLSTQPDSNFALAINPGTHSVELVLRKLPLAAGDYVLSAALTIPNLDVLWHSPDLAGLTVHPRDIYDSGRAPALPQSQVAIEHEWRVQ